MPHTKSTPAPSPAARTPLLYLASLFVHHTKKTCAVALAIPLLAIVIIAISGSLTLDNPDTSHYFVRNHPVVRLADARTAARESYPFNPPVQDAAEPERQQERPLFTFILLTRGRRHHSSVNSTSTGKLSVINPTAFALHKRAEDVVWTSSEHKKFCLFDPKARDCDGNVPSCVLPHSVLNHPLLYGVVDSTGRLCGRRSGHEPVPSYQFSAFVNLLFTNHSSGTVNPHFAPAFGKDMTASARDTWIMRSYLRIGQPFANYTSLAAKREEQEQKYIDWALPLQKAVQRLSTKMHTTYILGYVLGNASFAKIALRDLTFSAAAITLVFLVIWIHTSSAFLAASAMLQIFLAFPLAYVFYHFAFRQLYFSGLQILAIFLILGIGADDVFVFTDAWKQAIVVLGPNVDLVNRMSWTYRRAVKAMTVTSLTTAAAFFVTATNPIMPISTLGVWAGLLILLQFFLVITIYPCAIIIWYRFWRPRLIVRLFQRIPPDLVEDEVNTPLWHRALPKCWRPEVKNSTNEYRALERFFRGPWFKIIRFLRFILVAIAILFMATCSWLATGLEPPTEEEKFLPANHPIQEAVNVQAEMFPRGDTDYQLRVYVTWGIRDIDRSGITRFDLAENGKVVMDSSFDLRSAVAQQHVLKVCDTFESETSLLFQNAKSGNTVECWIRDFVVWRRTVLNTTDFTDFATTKELVDNLIQFAEYVTRKGDRPFRKYVDSQALAFDRERTRLVFAEVRFIAAVKKEAPYKVMWPVYNTWQSVLKMLNAQAPLGAKNAIVTGGQRWVWQITQRTLVNSMFIGIGVMLAVAWIVLTLTTLNWIIGIVATMSIAGILVMLLGMMRVLGWKLGSTESMGVVISVGYSFDYVAHIATAYVESRGATREERTIDALGDLGISIFFGAVSTLCAGLMLFPAIITFFVKFAGLIVTTVTLSLVWSLCLFPAALLVVGPNQECGSLKAVVKWMLGCFKWGNDEKEVEDGERVESVKVEWTESTASGKSAESAESTNSMKAIADLTVKREAGADV